jgi:cell division protein FtsB
LKKFSIKELSRIEAELDSELQFVEGRLAGNLRKNQSTVSAATTAALTAIKSALDKQELLLNLKFDLRNIKATFNIEKGINDRTIKIAKLVARKEFLERRITVLGDVEVIEAYGNHKDTYRPGITEETQDTYRAEVRNLSRQIQRLKDSCNGINSQGGIELTAETVDNLTKLGLIDA